MLTKNAQKTLVIICLIVGSFIVVSSIALSFLESLPVKWHTGINYTLCSSLGICILLATNLIIPIIKYNESK